MDPLRLPVKKSASFVLTANALSLSHREDTLAFWQVKGQSGGVDSCTSIANAAAALYDVLASKGMQLLLRMFAKRVLVCLPLGAQCGVA